jgi:hypothetical protein
VFEEWWSRTARSEYLGFANGLPAREVTFYYDPTIDHHHRLPVGRAGLFPAYFLASQKPAEARALLNAVTAEAGMAGLAAPIELPGPQRTPMLIHLAKEWSLAALADSLQHAADERYEPTWDQERGEFTWGFGLGEEHPRGQFNAAMAAAEVMSEGAWWRLFNVGPGDRYGQPTVCGIDFPNVTLTQAWWDDGEARLLLATDAVNGSVVGQPTRFGIAKLEEPSAWTVESPDGAPVATATVGLELEVTTVIGSHRFLARRA